MRWGVVTFPGSNDDRDMLRVAERVLGDEAVPLWHKDDDLHGRRLRRPAGRLLVRRLPALRRDRALLADHGGGGAARRAPAAWCSASATASRSCARRVCCRARWCATAALGVRLRAWSRCGSRPPTRRSPTAAAAASVLDAARSSTARAATSPTRRRSRRSRRTARSSSATPTARGARCPEANPNGSLGNIAGVCNARRATSSA